MKKTLLIVVCALSTLSLSAQRASSSSTSFFSTDKSETGITFGIRAGLNFSNVSYESNNVSVSTDARTTFHLGVIADIPFVESLHLETGLYLTNKGYKTEEHYYDEYIGDIKDEVTGKPLYMEIPILASYRYNFSDNLQLQINTGPYIAFGIGGKQKSELSAVGYESESEEIDYFGDDKDQAGFKRFDLGWQGGVGLLISQHYYLGISFENSFINTASSKGDDDWKVKNQNVMLSLGYNF